MQTCNIEDYNTFLSGSFSRRLFDGFLYNGSFGKKLWLGWHCVQNLTSLWLRPLLYVVMTETVLFWQHLHFELNGKRIVVVMRSWLSLQYKKNSLIHSSLALVWLNQHSEQFFRFFLMLLLNFARQFQSPLDSTWNGWVFSGRPVLIHCSYQFLLLHTLCVNADGVESRLVIPPGVLTWEWSLRGVH